VETFADVGAYELFVWFLVFGFLGFFSLGTEQILADYFGS
jgi:hypothetical protein